MVKSKGINSKVIDNQESSAEDFSSRDDCRCFERERLKCSGKFEFDEERRLCVNGKDVTNVLLSCSKYECSGQIHSFNFDTKKWETK